MLYGLMLGLILTIGISVSIPMVASHYYGPGFDPDHPLSGGLTDRVHQGKTIADMRAVATATTGYFLSAGRYPEDLAQLELSGTVDGFSPTDGWGNPWIYRTDGRHFILLSLGSDGTRGPEAPTPWNGEEYAPDLIIKDGAWLQMPRRVGLTSVRKRLERQKEPTESTENATRGRIGQR